MDNLPRTCIIGAGSSGIAVCKVFQEQGLPYDCFEKSDRIGGNWVFRNANGMSSAYRSLHINTSRDKMAYSDFPMPADYPDYPHHEQIAAYFDAYADHFGFRDAITFETSVTRCHRQPDGLWRITLDTGETRLYDALVVANGHHWDARWPDPPFPGHFNGEQLHSHNYIDPDDPVEMKGKNVLIVGFGNSALDLASELGRKGVANHLFLSMRRGYWVFPRYFGNKVLDYFSPHPSQDPPLLMRLLPARFAAARIIKAVEQVVGRPEDHGLPKPEAGISATHPAIGHELYNRIGSGDVLVRSNVKELKGRQVEFADGVLEDIDVIIWCTGYKITFPFFDPDFIAAPGNDIALWKRMMDPRYDNLFFVALLQPLCAMMPIAEEQAHFVAAYLRGEYKLPDRATMAHERNAMHQRIKAGYVNSPRHTIQINCGEYTYDLRRELKRGRRRAKAAGYPMPVPVHTYKKPPSTHPNRDRQTAHHT